MAQVTAAMVKELREKTQLPMMDCKKALQEAGGDPAKAEDILRKSGALAAAKKAGRETAEGRVATCVSDDNKAGAIIEVRCETAPVANGDDFIALCDRVAKHVAAVETLPDTPEDMLKQTGPGETEKTVEDLFNDTINKIRENMQLVRFTRLEGNLVTSYVHHNGQVAVVIQLDVDPALASDENVLQFARDLCMHITAINPMALNREGIPAEVLASEKEVIQAQVQQQAANKPPEIVEKIVNGKLNKWFGERVLLEQMFVKDDKKTVKQVIDEFSKSVGKPIDIKCYVRYEVGGTG